MNAWLPLARRWLALPAPRVRTEDATEWVALSDGTRLATTLFRPIAAQPRGAVLIRTPDGPDSPLQMPFLLGRLLAERGTAVVVQECRGRGRSEGRFTPFRHEAGDGAEAIAWVTAQTWFPGRLALVGLGYAGYAAWAALGATDLAVACLVAGFAGRDPYAAFYTGGALQLEFALAGIGMGERQRMATGELDLARGARHRPVREADRVTPGRWDPFRDWVDHPEPDDFWRELTPPLPQRPPATLLVGGWHHPALDGQLRDFDALSAAKHTADPAPELVVGPWGVIQNLHRRRLSPFATAVRAAGDFLDRNLLGQEVRTAPVRVFVQGTDRWREGASWPPSTEERRWHLRSGGDANAADGDGRLDAAAADGDEPVDRFVYDPADAVPSHGGPMFASPSGLANQSHVEARADVLCFTSDPLATDLEVVGPVTVVLHATSDAPSTDFTARLVAVGAANETRSVCDGIRRCRADRGSGPHRLEIACSATAFRFRAGERLRVQVSSSNFPRFDRNPNTAVAPGVATDGDCRPAAQTVFHDAERASYLALRVVPF